MEELSKSQAGVSAQADEIIGMNAPDFDSAYRYNSEMFLDKGKHGQAQWSKLTKDNLREEDWDKVVVYYHVEDDEGGVFNVPTEHSDHTHAKYGLSYGAFLELTSSNSEPFSEQDTEKLIQMI